jgi:hypothetical protein
MFPSTMTYGELKEYLRSGDSMDAIEGTAAAAAEEEEEEELDVDLFDEEDNEEEAELEKNIVVMEKRLAKIKKAQGE